MNQMSKYTRKHILNETELKLIVQMFLFHDQRQRGAYIRIRGKELLADINRLNLSRKIGAMSAEGRIRKFDESALYPFE